MEPSASRIQRIAWPGRFLGHRLNLVRHLRHDRHDRVRIWNDQLLLGRVEWHRRNDGRVFIGGGNCLDRYGHDLFDDGLDECLVEVSKLCRLCVTSTLQ